ncbi:hypothetical protein ACFC1R_30505 [Kitasatospora sp. NPDC056138]|uniref:hypothetical protein n=1 Tax=Kitasatospora sp. NPDC056138 TaxID=3345724 RepID=UPI0035E0F93B
MPGALFRSVLRRRRFHRAKAHLVLSAIRRAAAALGEQMRDVQAGTYHGAWPGHRVGAG